MTKLTIPKLLAKNASFVNNPRLIKLREKLLSGQHPDVVVIGCSDSRVPPEVIFQLGSTLGRLFVIRTAGGVVDQIGMESVLYAIEHLKTKIIVVIGHHGCGAVTASCECVRAVSNPCEYPGFTSSIMSTFPESLKQSISNVSLTNKLPDKIIYSAIKYQARRTKDKIKKRVPDDVLVVSAVYNADGVVKIIR